jgi:hypothetical protein
MRNWLFGGVLIDLFALEAVVGIALLTLVIGVLVHAVLRGRPASEGDR